MKKILFVALNSSWSQSNLALYYMRQMIRDIDFETGILPFTMKEPLHQIMEEIYTQKPDVICLSAYIWNRVLLYGLQKELTKILPHCLFVIGGPEAAAFINSPGCHVIIGAGESEFRALAECDFVPRDCRQNPAPIPLKDIPFPYTYEDLADLEDHLIYYECYRGCPYACIYCLSANDKRHQPRFELSKAGETQRLKDELTQLAKLKPRTLKFIDRSFNIQKELAHAIWDFAIESDSTFDYHFEIYPDLLDETDFAILCRAPANRIRFEVGIQSTNPEVLERCGRHSDWQKSRRTLCELKERTKIRVHADLIAGLPGEDLDSVIRSLNELCLCEPAALQLGMLKILPDTPMHSIAIQREYLWMDLPPYQILRSDTLSYEELCLLQDYAHLLNLYWNKEEHPDLWHTLLQRYPADRILALLREMHLSKEMPLHSVSKQKREMMMQSLADKLQA
ncbi:MAG: DUF4080 domain-containing protein [Candidatus Cloacimonadales bacterium]|nr:DUF4080 domain-containing protein [Candidatus Cloacimonadota bacterium]MCB5257347.1 DUF4080 domain-containing protein [Candidatus Cloacimonadota bacterium]MCB5277218.1 DUF4080 domain-containing protein [Candidatus Cloacimonadota bacterium]